MVNLSSVSPIKVKSSKMDEKMLPVEKVTDEIEELHFAVWPRNDFDKVVATLNAKPGELETRFGVKMETLLHRYVYYISSHQ